MEKKKTPKGQVEKDCDALLSEAARVFSADGKRAKTLVRKAFALAMHHRIHLDPKRFCRTCFVPFVSGTLSVRQGRRNQTVLYSCRKCNYVRRIPYRS